MLKERVKNKKICIGQVKSINEVGLGLYEINIESKDFCSKPGQFISIYCDNCTLRRPFSIMKNGNNELSVLFKLKGKGTEYIKNLKTGDMINFTGPFGNGFSLTELFSESSSLLIGAGVGIAPIIFLRDYVKENCNGKMRTIGGFQTKSAIPLFLRSDLDFIATDDGTYGHKGSIVDYLYNEITANTPKIIYACGPSIVLQKICEIASEFDIPVQVAMEKEMACSIGVCRGCVIELKDGKNAAVCKDGPVFWGKDIKWG